VIFDIAGDALTMRTSVPAGHQYRQGYQKQKAANKRALPFGDAPSLAACPRAMREPSYWILSAPILLRRARHSIAFALFEAQK
jgi:hypothetical protein